MTYVMLVKPGCPYCQGAEDLFKEKGIEVEIYKLDTNNQKNDFSDREFKKKYGSSATYPRIYKKNKLIGGYSDLKDHFEQ